MCETAQPRCRFVRVATRVMVVWILASATIGTTACTRASTDAVHRASLQEWRDATFGLFIHWGIYSVPAGVWNDVRTRETSEWLQSTERIPAYRYAQFAQAFNPTHFDADEWLNIARRAGMKYVVVTAKHHDGFAMFQSRASPFNVVDATPFKRDVVRELSDAARRAKLRFGIYYSQAQDWHHPGGALQHPPWDPGQPGNMDDYITHVAAPQMRELLGNYDDVSIVWWDAPTDMNDHRAAPFKALLTGMPRVITNDRLGNSDGDFLTVEGHAPVAAFPHVRWETCLTMNDSWAFSSRDHHWKSTDTLIRQLVDVVSKGGNLLLNVGPTDTGMFPPEAVERLSGIGTWLDRNGTAIYGATSCGLEIPWGRCTRKGDVVYLHVFDAPPDGNLVIPRLKTPLARAWIVGDVSRTALATTHAVDGVRVSLPPDVGTLPAPFVVALELKGNLELAPNVIAATGNGEIVLRAQDATIRGGSAQLEGIGTVPFVGSWRDTESTVTWTVSIPESGFYEWDVDYACVTKHAGSTYTLTVDGETAEHVVAPTDGWERFVRHGSGRFHVGKPGPVTVTIKAKTLAAAYLMRLRSVVVRASETTGVPTR